VIILVFVAPDSEFLPPWVGFCRPIFFLDGFRSAEPGGWPALDCSLRRPADSAETAGNCPLL